MVTLHRADDVGNLHCLRCLVMPPIAPPVPSSAPTKQGGGLMVGTIKLAGFIVSVVFLVTLGTCVYICGSVAKEKPSTTTPAPSDRGTIERNRDRESERAKDRGDDPWK